MTTKKPSDRQRLDAVIEGEWSVVRFEGHVWVQGRSDGEGSHAEVGGQFDKYGQGIHKTARQAIDAAMKAKGKKK